MLVIKRPRTKLPGQRAGRVGSVCDKSETMNIRHAAALAIVGWYLMVPTRRLERKVRYGETASRRHK
jgi:hypothetical protein